MRSYSITDLFVQIGSGMIKYRRVFVATMALAMALTVGNLAAAASPTGLAGPDVGIMAAGPAERSDVNGDGIPDIIVATGARHAFSPDPQSPNEFGGSVYVIPGGSPLPSKPASLIRQNYPYGLESPEAGDKFSAQVVTGDFNGDRRADVAIGNPTESVGSLGNAGSVTVYYGQTAAPYLGLIPNGINYITQNTGTLAGSAEAGDYFGAALTSGDFNGDGYADLAIGAPGEAIGTIGAAGAVWVLYGGSNGVRVDNSKDFNQDSTGIPGNPEKNDHFGASLAAGDVTGDGRDDLAILVEGEDISGTTGAEGGVLLLKGSAGGVTASGNTVADVSTMNVGGSLNSVAIGRFHGGSNADVVLSADQVKNGASNSGALVVLRGGSGGISGTNRVVISQNSPGVSDGAEANDRFGEALGVGDVDGDGADDLAIGVPGEDFGNGADQGGVHVLLGGTSGLTSAVDLFFNENHAMIAANGQFGERFGGAVRFLDVTNDGRPELLVTAPTEDFAYETGTMFVLSLTRTSQSVALTGCTKLTRASLGDVSAYGPASPIAGGVIPAESLPNV